VKNIIFLLCFICIADILYSYDIQLDSADVIIKEKIEDYVFYPSGGLSFGDIDNDGRTDMTVDLHYGDPTLSEARIYILWGNLVDSNYIIVNNYPYISNIEYYSAMGWNEGVKLYDINHDGYDDLIYSFPINGPTPYISTICIKYGKPRILWPIVEHVTTMTNADVVIKGVFEGLSEGTSLILCDCDDSIGQELVSGSEVGTPEIVPYTGHASIINFDTIPDSGVTYIDSIAFCTFFGQTTRRGRPYPDTFVFFGNDMSNLGDLNNDGIEEFSSNAISWRIWMPIFCVLSVDTLSILAFWTPMNFIIWGRPRSLWNAYNRTIINPTTDSLLTIIYTFWQGQIAAGDIDGDGRRDLIISDFAIFIYSMYYSGWTWVAERDTPKIYIIFGGPGVDSLKGGIFLAKDIANLVIKSRFACDGTGTRTTVGDFNGDDIDDFAVQSTNKQDPGVIYVFFGNRERNFPRYIQNAPLKIVDDDTIHFGDTSFDSLFAISFLSMKDLNNDGIDELIAYNIHEFSYYSNLRGEINKLIDIGYIFVNKHLAVELLDYHNSTLGSSETLKFKINYKYPLKLSSIKVSINIDTFTILSPRLEYISTDSILILLPDSAWDSTKGYWICIQNITDTIGTPPDSLPLCFGFNGATTSVYEPPKPHTLSLTCYPNPFNAEVRIRLRMPDAGDTKIDIYDISGKLIDHIHKSKLTAGWHELVWRPRISVPSGVYLLRVSAGGEAVVRRVVLVR